VSAVLLAAAAGLAVLRLLVRRPRPRRDPSGRSAVRVADPDDPADPDVRVHLDHPSHHDDRSCRGDRGGAGIVRVASRGTRSLPRVRPPSVRWRIAGTARNATGPPADLVTCIDLLGVAATSGQTVADSVRSVGAVGSGPLAAGLAGVARAVDRGASLSERLEDLADRTGPEVRSLVSTLQVALRSGDGAAPALQRLADAERRRERRRRETRLRRLPVLLTVPLVLFVLPAFVVLTLVPVALSVAGDLPGLAAERPPSPAGAAPGTRPSPGTPPSPGTRDLPVALSHRSPP
jgi:hypothetical protein